MEYEAWKATWKAPLNPQQEAAVQAAQGPILLLAVPGSGKTTVMIEKIVRLITSGVDVREILAVTFTKKALVDCRKIWKKHEPSIKKPPKKAMTKASSDWKCWRGKTDLRIEI